MCGLLRQVNKRRRRSGLSQLPTEEAKKVSILIAQIERAKQTTAHGGILFFTKNHPSNLDRETPRPQPQQKEEKTPPKPIN